ncbi:P-loop containing nucleoside triphosphate hydrolase protein [Lindgomyces ingoldianus]|uniref:P-loop containing nucleoside triphosphate hydrolase protein n=1 Tax=Lindgomyces ingoldianus TaxID=673940 RepID=A0ACB6QW65_9PLEO|nr:P-loop containing nucleoside triphosphate hydrolase protein [Lindgomyces ingoldianus]KAF2471116.1 P-loop containing nucleoside triphosphate hydrolase protein [Lindgomyces ingoldianus]
MAAQEDASSRSARLSKYFDLIVKGKRELKTSADGPRFLEALCDEIDAAKRIEALIAAPKGLEAVAKAVRLSLDRPFLIGAGTDLLLYLTAPSLKQLCSGQFLYRVLEAIVEPPSFWNALLDAHEKRLLTERASHAFGWLLLEILSSHTEGLPNVRSIAEQVTENGSLTESSSLNVRNIGQKIKHVLSTTFTHSSEDGPGGRHDNDFANFREIKILPTSDEFVSKETPFYRTADAVASADIEARGAIHLDNQFRLLRENLLGELRNDFQTATGQQKGSRRNLVIPGLTFEGIDCGPETRRKFCSMKLRCQKDIPRMAHLTNAKNRLQFVKDNKNFIRHQSFGCLISDGNVVAFATVERDENLLSHSPPVIVLRIDDPASFTKVLLVTKSSPDLQFVQVDTAVFAFEPILKCLQRMTVLPLKEQIVDLQPGSSEENAHVVPATIIDKIQRNSQDDLRGILGTPKSIKLDRPQAESLLKGLTRKVSLIQGPPGTGKSFIGALLAKVIHDYTNEKILVICYTNHALDQFLEELLDIGIDARSIVRLGSKSTVRTKPLNITEQKSTYKHSRCTWTTIDNLRSLAEGYYESLTFKIARYRNFQVSKDALLEYLEFSDDSNFFDAFTVPEQSDGMSLVGSKGKKVGRHYLLDQWTAGYDPGVFKDSALPEYSGVWEMDLATRTTFFNRWIKDLLQENLLEIGNLLTGYNKCQERLGQLNRERDVHTIREKRIIGCTTTAAAMKAEGLRNASPGVILVEEAGEILESHILTAMTMNTKQLVMIGDHKQLRPKVDNFALTIEKGDGYNLNQSLFERLVLSEFPHSVLTAQHRMRPEISTLVRQLTYPELEDAPKTQNRPPLRGFQNNVMFISHDHPELNTQRIADRRDENVTSSRENEYEVDMVLKCVRYLGQQGYGTDKLVILTPYLGQLFLLRKKLLKDNDPILNDLDSWDLIRAGLVTPAAANISKQPIKISTIDNYQGEESDIVIASLTRSNPGGDIGFMSAPQRVNVLLSRARNALIMIGNAETFMSSRKGKDVWVPLMEQLKKDGHVYNGFPVKCERHPDKVALLTKKEDFDSVCPDGGCSELCGTMLNCGLHKCPQHCHNLKDHSKMACISIIKSTCPQKHKISRKCHDKSGAICHKCEAEARKQEERRQRDHKLEQEREAKQKHYANELSELQAEIEHEKWLVKDESDDRERQRVLAQHRQDLQILRNKKKAQQQQQQQQQQQVLNNPASSQSQDASKENASPPDPNQSTSQNSSATTKAKVTSNDEDDGNSKKPWESSEAKDDWDYQKNFEGQDNRALDALIGMIGLESVKQKFLDIKAKVDAIVRQGVSLKNERFGAALLGNPGTGKTTVARLYAKFLCKVGALPGDHFVETSGSGLANDGINACKKHIDDILNTGGGVFFIDEAYQLVSGNSSGGKAVLDYLLTEIENLTGKIAFVLAGYNKQMEAFFAHNPGIPSRIPIEMEFKDYEDEELLRILGYSINQRYNGAMKVEGGMGGLYARIVSRRIGRSRGRDGFGNARDVQNKLAIITERQAKRLKKQRRVGRNIDDHLLTKEDLIGPEPAAALKGNAAWAKLQKMIGLDAVKQSVKVLLDTIQFNYQRELDEKPIVEYSLNRCFVGSPGTGKTSVAKLYGKILADLNMLSNGEVVVRNPADFIGEHLGKSEAQTKAILASTVGKVLIIDEAYMLRPSKGGSGDAFKTAVVDTIVAEVQSTPGEDRCVLLLGYKDEMEVMLRDVNPGLARRFPLDSAFVFEDFEDCELRKILDLKLKDQGFEATDQAKQVAMDMLRRARNRPHFGNGGEIDIILDKAKLLHQQHLSTAKTKYKDKFEAIDFDPKFDRGALASTNLPLLFKGVIGCEDIIKQLQTYQNTAANMKTLGMDPRDQIPFNFLFKGPPGTGKTTTARRMGKVFYDMGFLANAAVEECSATDMIGQYIGHTGPKVQKLLEKALGKVLFIDEAYRLAEGQFATEAMDELVDCITKPKFARKLICILAGYDEHMDRLMSVNPGLTSRFSESMIFRHLTAEECLTLLTDLLQARRAPLDVSVLSSPSSGFRHQVLQKIKQLSGLKSWGNARDIQSIEKAVFSKLISSVTPPITNLSVTESVVLSALDTMLDERTPRSKEAGTSRHKPHITNPPVAPSESQPDNAPNIQTSTNTGTSASSPGPLIPATPGDEKEETVEETEVPDLGDTRDARISDEIWHQLQKDKLAAQAREQEHQRLEKERIAKEEQAAQEELRAKQELENLEKAEQDAKDDEERRRVEAERIRRVLEMRKQQEMLVELERRRQEAEKAREKEIVVQRKLRNLGVCVQGFRWIKQAGGYRCAGGAHFVTNAQLGL